MGMENGGKWSAEKRKLHINILKLLTVKNTICFYKRENNQCISYSDRQYNCPLAPSENGRYDKQKTSRFKQGHLEISDIEADQNYCRISPKYFEHKSRLAVSSQQGLLGMKVIPNNIPTLEMPMIHLFASRLSNQIAKYFAWKQYQHSLAMDAIQQEWNQKIL